MSGTTIGDAPVGTGVETSGQSGQSGQSVTQSGQSVTQQAASMKREGEEKLRSRIDEGTTQAGQELRSLAGALRRSGGELEQEAGGGSMNRLVGMVSDRLERAGGYLERVEGDDILRDAERFARSRPWLVATTAAVAGFAASRVLKASSENRYGQSHGTATASAR